MGAGGKREPNKCNTLRSHALIASGSGPGTRTRRVFRPEFILQDLIHSRACVAYFFLGNPPVHFGYELIVAKFGLDHANIRIAFNLPKLLIRNHFQTAIRGAAACSVHS
jgi:hypothetical protein